MGTRTRGFWGSIEHTQVASSQDVEIQRVLEVRAEIAYRLTGYRMQMRTRSNSTVWIDGDWNFSLALTVWEPSATMTVASSFDTRQTQSGLFAIPAKGTLDALIYGFRSVAVTAVSLAGYGHTLDTGWVPCDLLIPSLVLTAVTEVIGSDAVWQTGLNYEYESVRMSPLQAATLNQTWQVPKSHETTW